MYGHRHFVQALVVRRFLLEGMSSDRIADLMAGQATEELKLLLGGIEVVARGSGDEAGPASAAGDAVIWKRVSVIPGVELHLRGDVPRMKPAEVKKVLEPLERALRKNV